MAHFADMLEGNAKKNERRGAMRRREGIVKKPKSSKGAHAVVRVVGGAVSAVPCPIVGVCRVALAGKERAAEILKP